MSTGKSPEEYLSGLEFDAEEATGAGLSPGERAFVEKYLGYDALAGMPVLDPEPVRLPMLQPLPEQPRPQRPKAPEIIVAKAPQQIIVLPAAPELIIAPERTEVLAKEEVLEQTIAPEKIAVETETEAPVETITAAQEAVAARQDVAVEAEIAIERPVDELEDVEIATEVAVETGQTEKIGLATEVAAKVLTETPAEVATEAAAPVEVVEKVAAKAPAEIAAKVQAAVETAAPVAQAAAAPIKPVVKQELTLRDKMRQADEVQVVSFFVCGQLFLLPVMGIQEVLRYMELIRVPQAPPFIAGAMNLRGTVMPLVHLAAMVTNTTDWVYDEKSFIIVTGTENMKIGLIIDKVSSMHMVPQKKFIWNAESKLADAAEFLSAIVDLDDRVCGMVSPEAITQKILSEF